MIHQTYVTLELLAFWLHFGPYRRFAWLWRAVTPVDALELMGDEFDAVYR